jgi:hypothetical protein
MNSRAALNELRTLAAGQPGITEWQRLGILATRDIYDPREASDLHQSFEEKMRALSETGTEKARKEALAAIDAMEAASSMAH